MQLDKIIIALRKRTAWEAMDLGVMVMRKLWPILLFPWLILMSLSFLFATSAALQGYFYFSMFFIWWIKPVYDSLILHVLSRGIFGEYVNTSGVYTSMGDWLKTGIKTSIFIWRFSPSRSFDISINQLEGLNGYDRRKRLQALHRVSGSHSMAATILGIHFEYLIAITIYAVIFYIMPDTSSSFIDTMKENPESQTSWLILGLAIYAVTVFILEPFYVAAGFMLYLNRRTQLEGWDIELDFKRLTQRINESKGQVLSDG